MRLVAGTVIVVSRAAHAKAVGARGITKRDGIELDMWMPKRSGNISVREQGQDFKQGQIP
jgi:hypothetical protein